MYFYKYQLMNIAKTIIIYYITYILIRIIICIFIMGINELLIRLNSFIKNIIRKQILKDDRPIFNYKTYLLMSIFLNINKLYLYFIRFKSLSLKKYSKTAFNIKLTNLILLIFLYNFVVSSYNIELAMILSNSSINNFIFYIKNININQNVQGIILFVISIPILYNVYLYILMKMYKFDQDMHLCINPLVEIERAICNNLKVIQFEKRELVEKFLNDLTEDMPYKISNNKLLIKNKVELFHHGTEFRSRLVSINTECKQLEDIYEKRINVKKYSLRSKLLAKPINMIGKFINKIHYKFDGLEYLERKVIYNTIDECSHDFHKCKNYYATNKNPIYKYKCTKARVIRKEALVFLDHYEEKVLEHVNEFSQYIDNYIFSLIQNKVYIRSLYKKILKDIEVDNIFEDLIVIIKNTFKDYVGIIFKLFI